MLKRSSDSVRLGRVVVFTAAHGFKVSPGLGTIVVVSSVLVHSVERHATGLYVSCAGGT